jgi:hypothetical protein
MATSLLSAALLLAVYTSTGSFFQAKISLHTEPQRPYCVAGNAGIFSIPPNHILAIPGGRLEVREAHVRYHRRWSYIPHENLQVHADGLENF